MMNAAVASSLWYTADHIVDDVELSNLEDAIRWRKYTTLYAMLRKWEKPIAPHHAFMLCMRALEAGLTEKAFRAILERCPPLEEFVNIMGPTGLVERAAADDRVDILDLLLGLGASPNRQENCFSSPLEAAVLGRALHSTERLIREPELDCTLTPQLLKYWSEMDNGDVMLDFCLQTIAPRVLGYDGDLFVSLPIPDELTLVDTIHSSNFNLFQRICRERVCTPKEVKKALREFPGLSNDESAPACAAALDAIFSVCPALLRGQRAHQLVTAYALYHPGQARETLKPWLERIRDQGVSLYNFPRCGSLIEADELLNEWERYLPDGPAPVLDRRMELSTWLEVLENAPVQELLARLLHTCAIAGRKGKPDKISPLADTLISLGGMELIKEQLEPGGLLDGEDRGALLACCREKERPHPIRAILATCIKQEADYEL